MIGVQNKSNIQMAQFKRYKGHIALLAANIFLGVNFSYFYTLVREKFSPEALIFIVVAVPALFFIPLIFSKKYYTFSRDEILIIIATSALIILGREYLMLLAVKRTSAIDAAIIATLGPIITLIYAGFMRKEKMHRYKIIGIGLAASGALILLTKYGLFNEQHTEAIGNAIMFGSVIAAATNTVLIKPVILKHSTPVIVGWFYVIGLIIVTPAFLPSMFKIEWSTIPQSSYMLLFLMCIFGTALPNMLLYYGTRNLTSVHTAMYFYVQPLVATLLAIFRHTEHINTISVIASASIFAGLLFIIKFYKIYGFSPFDKNYNPKNNIQP